MNVEREIAGFALPFTAGILASISGIWPLCRSGALSALMFTCIILSYLTHQHRQRHSWRITLFLIAMTGFFCGITTGCTHSILSVGTPSDPGRITGLFLDLGNRMSEAIKRIPFRSPDTNALINALLTGERSDIPAATSDTFRKSGAAHILALSGLHIGIIYGIIYKSMTLLGNGYGATRLRSYMILTICGIYTLATGAGPSITRAFIFIVIAEMAKLSGRYRSTKSLFYTALTIQLAMSPLSLKSVSFQLSYAAIAGIAFIYPHFKGLWSVSGNGSKGLLQRIWESASLSIACQITTGPLAWIHFHSFPQYFILTNLIALPLTGLIIPVAILTLILNTLGICPQIITKATECLVETLTAALEIISSL